MTAEKSYLRPGLTGLLIVGSLLSCHKSKSSAKIAQLTPSQSLADVSALTATFQSLYGPLAFKAERFNFKYDDLVNKALDSARASTGDADTYAAITSFLANFHDGHVHISFPGNATGVTSYLLNFNITPIEGRTIVSAVDASDSELSAIKIGDELTTIDGKRPLDLLPLVLKYDVTATQASDQHQISNILNRPFYMKELIPTSDDAVLVFTRPDSSSYTVTTAWQKAPVFDRSDDDVPAKNAVKNMLARHQYQVINRKYATLEQIGQQEPYFTTDAVKSTYHLTPVVVSADYLKKYHLTAAPAIAAYTYAYNGHTILLIRQPAYNIDTIKADTLIGGYRAILDQMQSSTDVLVIDQTHNPGGDIDYATQFFQLFVSGTADNEVEHLHVDRKWIYDVQAEISDGKDAASSAGTDGKSATSGEAMTPDQIATLQSAAASLDTLSNSGGATLTPVPYPLSAGNRIGGDSVFTWKKPILVLADELAGSCGDLFPMLMQRNHIAKTFGQATMGLGGNVDDNAITLPFSQAKVDVTRGLYTTYRADGSYSNADLVENVGIPADYPYTPTVADFRAGYLGYVKAFSDVALAQLPAGK